MQTNLQTGLIAIGINIIVVIGCFKILNVIDRRVIEKIKSQELNSPLLRFIPIFMKLIKAIVLFFVLTGILQSFGYSMSSIIAGFGIGGLAIGMAAKETIANVFGSISLLSDRVYRIGDYVKVDGIEGYVEDVNIRSTKIRDLDNFLITVPNNVAANAVITNVSKAKKRFLNITFGILYSTPNEKIQKAQEILKEIAKNHNEINNDYTVAVHDLAESSINIRFRGYIKTGSYEKFLKVRGEFLGLVIKEFRANGIDFAFPSRSVYIESDKTKIEH